MQRCINHFTPSTGSFPSRYFCRAGGVSERLGRGGGGKWPRRAHLTLALHSYPCSSCDQKRGDHAVSVICKARGAVMLIAASVPIQPFPDCRRVGQQHKQILPNNVPSFLPISGYYLDWRTVQRATLLLRQTGRAKEQDVQKNQTAV